MYNNNNITKFKVITGGKSMKNFDIKLVEENELKSTDVQLIEGYRIMFDYSEWIIKEIHGKKVKISRLNLFETTKTYNLSYYKKLCIENRIRPALQVGNPIIVTEEQKREFKDIEKTYNKNDRCNLADNIIRFLTLGVTRNELENMLENLYIVSDERMKPLLDSIFNEEINNNGTASNFEEAVNDIKIRLTKELVGKDMDYEKLIYKYIHNFKFGNDWLWSCLEDEDLLEINNLRGYFKIRLKNKNQKREELIKIGFNVISTCEEDITWTSFNIKEIKIA